MTDAPAEPRDPRGDALAVVRRLREAGHVAYFAGGCVRDALLGLEPRDYDVPRRPAGPRPQRFRDAAVGPLRVNPCGSAASRSRWRRSGGGQVPRRPPAEP